VPVWRIIVDQAHFNWQAVLVLIGKNFLDTVNSRRLVHHRNQVLQLLHLNILLQHV
jgi:hypothetical protein